jgi:hypothetical protein
MAKLSARGRKEVYRLVKMQPDDENTTNNRTYRALMSDKTVLYKETFEWKIGSAGASSYGGSNHHSFGWKRLGKLKKGITSEQWLESRLAGGWRQA